MKKLKVFVKKHPVTQYALDITSGKILANKWVRLACQRHLNDLKDGEKRGLYFDEAAANHIIDFYPTFLRNPKRSGLLNRPIKNMLTAGLWQDMMSKASAT